MAVVDSPWSPSSWRGLPALHQPDWPDEEQLAAALAELAAAAAARLRGRGRAAAGVARGGRRGAGVPAPGRRLRRVVPRPERADDPGEAEDPAPDGGRADLRRHAAGREGRPDRRPVREAALVADRAGRRPRAAVVPRPHDQRRGPDIRGPHPRSRIAWCRAYHQSACDAEPPARVHEGRLRRPHARPRVESGVRAELARGPALRAARQPRSSGRCASWPPAASISPSSGSCTRSTSGRATRALLLDYEEPLTRRDSTDRRLVRLLRSHALDRRADAAAGRRARRVLRRGAQPGRRQARPDSVARGCRSSCASG